MNQTVTVQETQPANVQAAKDAQLRAMYLEFVQHCERQKTRKELSAENMMLWDAKYNGSRIMESFGGKQAIYKAGLLAKYRAFIDTYSAIRIRIEGKRISVATVRKTPNGLRRINDPKLTDVEREYILNKAERELAAQVLRVRFLGLSPERIIAVVEKALETTEDDVLLN